MIGSYLYAKFESKYKTEYAEEVCVCAREREGVICKLLGNGKINNKGSSNANLNWYIL